MLTTAESLQFIEDVLKIPDPESEMKRDKYNFLNKLITSIVGIPFQCVTLLDKRLEERRRPTVDEVKASMLEGKGGLCYTFNLFTYYLLKSIGYDVHLNRCQCPHDGILADNHLIVLAFNLKKAGDIYLVEAGCATPCFEAISLDFEVESPIYYASYLRYKFIKTGDKIQRLHDRSGFELSSGKPTQTEPFELFYEFEVKPTEDLNGIFEYFDVIYTNPHKSAFHKSLRAIKFIDRRMIVICNSKLALETKSGEISVMTLKDDQELVNAYRKYFPELDESAVKKAIFNWRNDTY